MQPNYDIEALDGQGWLLPAVFSPAECQALIERISAAGPQDPRPAYPPSYRNNDRLVLDDAALGAEIFARIAPLVPGELVSGGRRWRLVGINPRLRACRYRAGQRFSRHRDGPFCPTPRRRSLLSVVLYLDDAGDAFTGGRTRFFAAQHAATPIAELRPEAGRVAVFAHALWHEGEAVESGTKHVLRSDLVFEVLEDGNALSAAIAPAGGFIPPIAGQDPPEGHAGYVWSLLELDDRTLLSSGRDGTIRRWGPGLEALGCTPAETESILCLERAGAERVVGGTRSGRLLFWALDAGGILAQEELEAGATGGLLAQRGLGLGAGAAGGILSQEELELGAGAILSLAQLGGARCRPDEPASRGDRSPGHVWARYRRGEPACGRDRFAQRFVAGAASGELIVVEADGQISARIQAHDSWAWCVRQGPSGTLFSVGEDGCLVESDPARGVMGRRQAPGEVPLCALAVDAGGVCLSGDRAGRILRWEPAGPRVIAERRGAVTTLATARDGSILSGDEAGEVVRLSGSSSTLLHRHRDFVTRVIARADSGVVSSSYDGRLLASL